MEEKQIPTWLDYSKVPSLRLEARQKLAKHRPATVGQASRISGISPADISLILVTMKRGQKSDDSTPTVGCEGHVGSEEHGEEPNAHNTCCGDL